MIILVLICAWKLSAVDFSVLNKYISEDYLLISKFLLIKEFDPHMNHILSCINKSLLKTFVLKSDMQFFRSGQRPYYFVIRCWYYIINSLCTEFSMSSFLFS